MHAVFIMVGVNYIFAISFGFINITFNGHSAYTVKGMQTQSDVLRDNCKVCITYLK